MLKEAFVDPLLDHVRERFHRYDIIDEKELNTSVAKSGEVLKGL